MAAKKTAQSKKKSTAPKKPKTSPAAYSTVQVEEDGISFDVIKIDTPERKPLRVDLGGVIYEIMPIKSAIAMELGSKVMGAESDPDKFDKTLKDLVAGVFSAKDAKGVMARIKDPQDPLDMLHILTLVEVMLEKTAGNPTT